MAENHHKYTGMLLILFALLILLGAIMFTIAQSKIMTISEYKTGNSKLNSAKNNIMIAYILGYVAAGMALVLAILYFGHVTWGINSEIPHLIMFILLFGLVIVSGVFAFISLSNISSSNTTDNKGAPGWIWAGLISGLVALIVLIISGAWRAQHVSSKSAPTGPTLKTQQTTTFKAPSEVNYEPPANVSLSPEYKAPMLESGSRTVYSTTTPEYTTQGSYSYV